MNKVRMVACAMCNGLGNTDIGTCPQCDGIGRVAKREKPMLTSTTHGQTFFRGALVSQNFNRKGTKR